MHRASYKVKVEPHGVELDVKDGQTVFRVANEAGLAWPTRCGGASSCTLCTMIVVDGHENLSQPSDEERLLCAPLARRDGVQPEQLRMACAARVRGPVIVAPRHPLGVATEQDGSEAVSA